MRKGLSINTLLLFFIFGAAFTTTAQDSTTVNNLDTSQLSNLKGEKDFTDVLHQLLKKSKSPRKDAQSNVHKALVPAAGYSLQTGFAVLLSGNIGFYPGGSNTEGKVSTISSSLTYSQYNQIILPLQADLWSKNCKYNIISDFRYLKYPSITYGLGGNSDINNVDNIDFSYLKLHQTVLRKLSKNFYGGVGYYFDYFWNIKEVDPPPGIVTEFQTYGLTKTVVASGIALRLTYDSRLNPINATQGVFGNIIFRPNFKFMGSDDNWQSLLVEVRKYLPFPASSHNTLAFWSYNLLTLGGKPPYLLLPSTGWDDFYNTGRGFIQGRFRDRNMMYLESEYRFRVTHDGLIGGVVFVNAQSFSPAISKELSVVAPGYGLGLRIKLNKYSNTNLCIDYGFGTQGSKGLAVNLGEVF